MCYKQNLLVLWILIRKLIFYGEKVGSSVSSGRISPPNTYTRKPSIMIPTTVKFLLIRFDLFITICD